MRVFGFRRSVSLLLAILLHGVLVSQFDPGVTVAAATVHVRGTELLRSLSRYRQLLQDDDTSRPDLAKQPESSLEQKEQTTEEPEKNVEQFQTTQEAETPNSNTDVKENENLNTEKTELQNGDQEKRAGESEVFSADKQDEEQPAEEENTEQKNRGEETPVDNAERREDLQDFSAQNEEHQDKAEERKSDQSAENQQPGEERKEPESKTEEQTDESESKTDEKNSQADDKSEETNDSEGKTEEENTEERKDDESKPEEEKPFVFPEPYLLTPTIKDWDEQRATWLDANPHMKSMPDGKPRVLIVTGSQPNPCRSPVGDHFNLKSLKLKMDYARMHNYEIYYNFVWLDPLFGSYWVKLPTIRNLMLAHPEIEWFFWTDSDAVFTDMLFEAPFHEYEGVNMVMWGYEHGFFDLKSWVAFNAGVFLLRNCQWSLDLIDKWSPMGPDGPANVEYGKMLTNFLSNRLENYPADDQSALAYLILTDEEVKARVRLVDLNEYMVSAWWIDVVDHLEEYVENAHPGLGDWRWPWITHFTGCGPCGGDINDAHYQKCMGNFTRVFNFADNQVLAYMGFQHESLTSDSVIRTRNESDRPLELLGVNPWEEQMAKLNASGWSFWT